MPPTLTATNPDLAPRKAIHSDEYVKRITAAQAKLAKIQGVDDPNLVKVSYRDKQQHLAQVLTDRSNYMERLGQGMIGPIQLKLRYQGMTRNVLLEDPLTPGIPVEYDILDDLGQAYTLHGTEGEVRMQRFEGKKAPVRVYRIASFPTIKKEELWQLRVDIVEYAQDESKQAILKQEDARLITLIDDAITNYGTNANHTVSPGEHEVNELSGYLTPDSLYDLVKLTDVHELRAARILINPANYRDIYKWDINQTGWRFKDDIVAGETVESYGEFQIQRSVMVPEDTIYITPAPEFLGILPVMYSLDVEENHRVESFQRGWVMDEYLGFAILNPRGLGRIVVA